MMFNRRIAIDLKKTSFIHKQAQTYLKQKSSLRLISVLFPITYSRESQICLRCLQGLANHNTILISTMMKPQKLVNLGLSKIERNLCIIQIRASFFMLNFYKEVKYSAVRDRGGDDFDRVKEDGG